MSDTLNRALSVSATAIGLSVALVVLFVVCALAQFVAPGLQASHAWVGLFTSAPEASLRAWIDGLAFSVAFGVLTGATFAATYNAVATRSR